MYGASYGKISEYDDRVCLEERAEFFSHHTGESARPARDGYIEFPPQIEICLRRTLVFVSGFYVLLTKLHPLRHQKLLGKDREYHLLWG